MTEHILIYGGKGWIGNQVVQLLEKQKIKHTISNLHINELDVLEKEIKETQPTNIFCFIGRTSGTHEGTLFNTIDYLEQPGKIYENVRDNLYSPVGLAILCQKHNIHFTYMGTGCIFEYDNEHPFGEEINGFTEKDKPNFFGSSYSVVKGFTDQLMHLFPDTVLNIRIRMPITNGTDKKDFISKIMKYERVCNVPNSMTVLPILLPIMVDLALKKETGTYNLTNPGLISHNEILEMYKALVDSDFTWKNFSLEEQDKILHSKRSNNFLDTCKLIEKYPDVPDIKTAVKNVILEMKK